MSIQVSQPTGMSQLMRQHISLYACSYCHTTTGISQCNICTGVHTIRVVIDYPIHAIQLQPSRIIRVGTHLSKLGNGIDVKPIHIAHLRHTRQGKGHGDLSIDPVGLADPAFDCRGGDGGNAVGSYNVGVDRNRLGCQHPPPDVGDYGTAGQPAVPDMPIYSFLSRTLRYSTFIGGPWWSWIAM